MPESLGSVLAKCYDEYVKSTPKKLKIIDAYLAYIMLTGIMQFVYCCLVGTFPFNSFLSGFISCVGSFVLGGNQAGSLLSPFELILIKGIKSCVCVCVCVCVARS